MSDTTQSLVKEVFEKLVKVLPMQDALFLASLHSNGFVSYNDLQEIQSKPVNVEKSLYFLDYVIEPCLRVGYNQAFVKLVDMVMGDVSGKVKDLGEEIKTKMKDIPTDNITG